MENLIFSLNATMPIFLLMVLGYIFEKIGLINEAAAKWMNKFVFKLALPMLLFRDLALQDFKNSWDGKFVLFCILVTILSIACISIVSLIFIKDKGERGEFIQGSYRSSAALLGIAFVNNIYGSASTGIAPLMVLGSVPLYNIFAVIILTVTADDNGKSSVNKKVLIKDTLFGIITNPIILGIVIGMCWSLIEIPIPKVLDSITAQISALATPLGLMSMGATFDIKKASKNIKPALIASFVKLFLLVAIFMPIAVGMGFVGEQIIAILVMLGSATTISCYIMAKSMGHEGTLSSSIIMITTLGCGFSLTFWLFILKSIGVI
ncbi:AEC family transporter [Butyrivibrio sp. CB08]|uniref:AEC family transporter n=1 Tax=Butyrivibrio sp. CB08 TaxID=2364879 RepID=UPI000EA9B397|nr:AEC family transporter [Butyrivibrio sp. CB08]RKM59427.1 AEC family transporter [Butyrivibrio sp. CB08]